VTGRIHHENDTANLPVPTTPEPSGDAALRHAISVLENYGDHHEWCARAGGSGEPCNCGLWDELERLRAALTPPPPAEPTLDVERLTWAMHLVEQHGTDQPCYHDRATSAWPNGAAIAAEYTRLAARPDTEPDPS